MEEIQGDVAAIFGILFEGQRSESAAGMEVTQRLYHELRGEVGHEDPRNPKLQKRSRGIER